MFHWDEEAQKYCVNRTEATEVDHLDHKRLNISVNLRYPTSRIMNDIEEILNLLREERSGGGEALHNEITGKKYTLKTKSPSYSHLMEQAQVPERGEHRDQEFALGSNPFSIKTLVRLYDAMLIKRMAPRDFTHQDILEVLDPNHCILSETDNWIKKKMKQVMPLINDPESFLLRTPPKESF
jgi:hypothetical protein